MDGFDSSWPGRSVAVYLLRTTVRNCLVACICNIEGVYTELIPHGEVRPKFCKSLL
jgi:hypothetical protein